MNHEVVAYALTLKAWTTVSTYERTHMGQKANDKHDILSHLFCIFHVIWFDWLTDKKKTSRAPFRSLPWNNAWTCGGLQVGVTQEKTWKEEISIYENEKEVIRCNVWELITSEKRTVVLWRMTQRGGLISSTCYPEGFSSLWERDKCIRETKEGRMKHRTELIRWETKKQKEACHIIVVSSS